ncbi:hypothetical protein MSWHS_1622 [Methanosarcina sp. WWM596]|nr:hypothetical protein MSWHS_1622 [Methanosarcina sp. WWM596]
MLTEKTSKNGLQAVTVEEITLSTAASLSPSINLFTVYRPDVIENQTSAGCNETGSDSKMFVTSARPAIERPTIIPEEKTKARNLFIIFTFQTFVLVYKNPDKLKQSR